jgi:uncharacterized protein YqjF (DUF2071 family)
MWVDPRVITPLVPARNRKSISKTVRLSSVSLGFYFSTHASSGLPIPLHRDFEEVNLRFLRPEKIGWIRGRRGVVFIRELVPRRAIALVARTFYGENYVAVPMKHEIEHLDQNLKVEYSWRRGRKWESLKMTATGEAQSIPAGSHAEFITEHYWGYTALRSGCSEYRVEHPRWKFGMRLSSNLMQDIATLYGEQFTETFSQSPLWIYCGRLADYGSERRGIVGVCKCGHAIVSSDYLLLSRSRILETWSQRFRI